MMRHLAIWEGYSRLAVATQAMERCISKLNGRDNNSEK